MTLRCTRCGLPRQKNRLGYDTHAACFLSASSQDALWQLKASSGGRLTEARMAADLGIPRHLVRVQLEAARLRAQAVARVRAARHGGASRRRGRSAR